MVTTLTQNLEEVVDLAGLRVAYCQTPVRVGSVEENTAAIVEAAAAAAAAGADLLVTPEMAVTGYPCDDLLLDRAFVAAAERALDVIAAATSLPVLVGTVVDPSSAWLRPGQLVTAARDSSPREAVAVAALVTPSQDLGPDGRSDAEKSCVAKQLLPTYAVFDDGRLLTAGSPTQPLLTVTNAAGTPVNLGVVICEDLWPTPTPDRQTPAQRAADLGADALLAVNASPFSVGKSSQRLEVAAAAVNSTGLPLLYVNSVGGHDELVFDGSSFALNEAGVVVHTGIFGDPDLSRTETENNTGNSKTVKTGKTDAEKLGEAAGQVWHMATLGLRDYVRGNGFTKVVLGLSGGIDSAVVAAVACDALGAQNVLGLALPGPYSSTGSVTDALDLAARLGMRCDTIGIAEPVSERLGALGQLLSEAPSSRAAGLAEENLQARVRAITLMAVANAHERLLLTTGNKSENAVGYSTLYGDSCGTAPNPIGDVYKTTITYPDGTVLPGVYDLARWRNEHTPHDRAEPAPIPQSTIDKAPSAELAPGQQDSDSLPAYPVLDDVLLRHLELGQDPDEIADALTLVGYEQEEARQLTARVISLVRRAEFKRRQGPPRVRVSKKAFGRDRRFPITNGWAHPQ